MTQSKSTGTQNNQSGSSQTEADAKATVKPADKSGHDHMSREIAGKDKGAGGGAKQEQKH